MNTGSLWLRKHWIILAGILLFTVLTRFLNLGGIPLSEMEASQAISFLPQSVGISSWSGEPLYHTLTSLLVGVFTPTNTLIRFIPALAGFLLVLLPLFFRYYLGERVAILLSIILAIDPALVYLSRITGGILLGLVFGAFALLMALRGKPSAAGALAGLCLISSSAFWIFLVPLSGAVLITRLVTKKPGGTETAFLAMLSQRTFWLSGIFAILLGSTAFLIQPQGVGAILGPIGGFLTTWSRSDGLPLQSIGIGVLVYFLPILITGIWGAVRGLLDGSRQSWFLVTWFIFSLIVMILLPGRQLPDFVIASIPIDLLAAKELSRHLHLDVEEKLPILGVSLLVFTVFIFCYFSIARLAYSTDVKQLWLAVAGAAAILILSAILIILGWSQRIAFRGYFWGVFIILTLSALSTAWRVTGNGTDGMVEMMGPGVSHPQLGLLHRTINDISKQNMLSKEIVNIDVAGVSSDALSWELREFTNLHLVAAVEKGSSTDIVISPPDLDVSLADGYRGQDFTLGMTIDWERFNLVDWIAWMVRRRVLTDESKVVLWVRGDLFPGGGINTSTP